MNEERNRMRWMERGLFILGLLLLVHPVVSSRFFFTVDGPAHVYNASLLLDLFTTSAEQRGWEVNPVPVPNWTGHVLLALLQLVVEAPEALKVVYLMCAVGLPLAFRAVVKQYAIGPPWASLLALPMAMHLPFSMGFINFSIGIVLFILVVHRWERLTRTSFAKREWWYLAFLLFVLYFSHLVPFAFALIWLGVQWSCAAFDPRSEGSRDGRYWLGKAGLLVLCALPGLLGTMSYLFTSGLEGTSYSNAQGEEPDRLRILFLPFQSVSSPSELFYWSAFLFVVGSVILGLLIDTTSSQPEGRRRTSASLIASCLSFLVAGILFTTLPDLIGRAGDVLIRITLLMHLSAFVVIVHLRVPRSAGLTLSLVSCGMVLVQSYNRSDMLRRGEERTRQCYEACSKLQGGTTLATLAFAWPDAHLAEMAAADRGLLHLSNYEFINPQFQLRWTPDIVHQMQTFPDDPFDRLTPYSNIRGALVRVADNIVVIGTIPREMGPGQSFDLLYELGKTHVLVQENATCKVYSRH